MQRASAVLPAYLPAITIAMASSFSQWRSTSMLLFFCEASISHEAMSDFSFWLWLSGVSTTTCSTEIELPALIRSVMRSLHHLVIVCQSSIIQVRGKKVKSMRASQGMKLKVSSTVIAPRSCTTIECHRFSSSIRKDFAKAKVLMTSNENQ